VDRIFAERFGLLLVPGAFEELLGLLRETEEWRYVTREVQSSLRRSGARTTQLSMC
jgi:hypothetical protein